ncbi:NADPH:quinone reductase [Cupriavidus sp. IDO]|uniref:NADPH:quinone reductase n=1 Tax=Cupriavidus sp. IDO TaxID=1539142 RepID=UPI0005791D4C|nr:NADPH:quinone reductase [Cupriavidus sp. IDO]KWR86646.1 alcohol dehydrogenase [Cupriavidus sp. IDO]
MKAIWYEKQGRAEEVLQFGDLPAPQPAPGEVRVRLHASAVNPGDVNRRAGRMHGGMEFPRIIPNSDGAGVIDRLGDGVDRRMLGSRVWLHFGQRGRPFGTAAEYICLPHELTSPLPEHLDFAQGASLGIPAMTAYWSLFQHGAIKGKRILVTGGAGAVGHYAVQLAKWGGAYVVATTSSERKAAHATLGGADVVIDYASADAALQVLDATQGRGVDHIVDVNAVDNAGLCLQVAANHAQWVSYASGAHQALPLVALIRKNLCLQGLYLPGLPCEVRWIIQEGLSRWMKDVPDAIHAVDSIFDLRDTVKAHLAVEAGTKLGTVVVRCDTE